MNKLLKKIYANCDPATVEANKKLPKPCYGNSDGYYCNYECKAREGCYGITMQKWGVCDCKYRPSCHIPRQMLQETFKKEQPGHVCDFLKYFNDEEYPNIVVPEGIIKMAPIKHR